MPLGGDSPFAACRRFCEPLQRKNGGEAISPTSQKPLTMTCTSADNEWRRRILWAWPCQNGRCQLINGESRIIGGASWIRRAS